MSKEWILYLVLLLLSIAGCGGDDSTSTQPPEGNNVVTISVQDNFFEPRSVRVSPGTTVRWVMRGSMTNHTVTANNGMFDSGFVFRREGDSFERNFTMADVDKTILYHCEAHWVSDEMQGSILVGANAPPPPARY
jgi:plastocyanin